MLLVDLLTRMGEPPRVRIPLVPPGLNSNQTPEVTMAFNTITVANLVFNSIGNGIYNLATKVFGDAPDGFRIIPGKRAGKTGPTTFTLTRFQEKDVVFEGVAAPKRVRLSVATQVTVPDGFTALEVSTLMSSSAAFLTEANVNRILLGDS